MADQGKDLSAPLTLAHWDMLLAQMKTTMQTEVKKLIKVETEKLTSEVGSISTKQTNMETELKLVKKDLTLCQSQLKDMQGMYIKQSQEFSECKEKLEMVANKVDNNILKISGLEEEENEKCPDVVKDFFKSKLQLKKEIPMLDAFRVGKGTNRLIIVYLQNGRDKGLIFANASKLKDLKNNEDKAYLIYDQMSAKKKAQRNRNRHLMQINENVDAELKRDMKMDRGELMIDGKPYIKQLKTPSCREILEACKVQREVRLGKDLTKGHTQVFQKQEFTGYTAAVKSIEEVNHHYTKLRSFHTDSRHIICACRIVGRNFFINQDFLDDDEHGAGNILLNMLLESQIQNRVLFVVRTYDGTHIGLKRFELIKKAASSAIDRAPVNKVTGLHDCVWNSTEDEYQREGANNSIRGGRNRGRGTFKPRGYDHQSRAKQYMQGSLRKPGAPGSPTFAEAVRNLSAQDPNSSFTENK